jgi:hypothetical protein
MRRVEIGEKRGDRRFEEWIGRGSWFKNGGSAVESAQY